jgi:hypothetical protein
VNTKGSSNRVVEAYGGILWQKETDAVGLIRAWTGCAEEDAIEALKIWRQDQRVSSKSGGTIGELLDLLHLRPLPANTPKSEDWINMHELRALLARSKFHRKRSSGRPPAYDWAKVEIALAEECKLQEGAPRRDHSDRDWRTLTDACRFVREKFGWNAGGGPSDTALKSNLRPMLDRIRAIGGN